MSDEGLICSPVAGAGNVIPGSIIARCEECGQEVWLAPSGQRIVAEEAPTLLCIPCGMKAIAADPEPEIVPLNQEQRDEIAEYRRRRS